MLAQFSLEGMVALITGGTGYLGSAFASCLAEVGASVIISSTTLSRGEARARSHCRFALAFIHFIQTH